MSPSVKTEENFPALGPTSNLHLWRQNYIPLIQGIRGSSTCPGYLLNAMISCGLS